MAKNKLLIQIGANIRQLREEQGYSQEGFAYKSGMERSYYGRLERGEQNMSMLILTKLCLHLGCNPGVLVPGFYEIKKLLGNTK